MLTHKPHSRFGVFYYADPEGAVCQHNYSSEQVVGSTRPSLQCIWKIQTN